MPTETKTAVDYSSFVGKTFRTKAEQGLNSDRLFKIVELIPVKDFGTSYGKKSGFVVHRIPGPGVHTPECQSFLDAHEEITS